MTFYRWIKKFRGQGSAFGDLAADLAGDGCFPRRCVSLSAALGHLAYPHEASLAARAALRDAWARYEDENQVRR